MYWGWNLRLRAAQARVCSLPMEHKLCRQIWQDPGWNVQQHHPWPTVQVKCDVETGIDGWRNEGGEEWGHFWAERDQREVHQGRERVGLGSMSMWPNAIPLLFSFCQLYTTWFCIRTEETQWLRGLSPGQINKNFLTPMRLLLLLPPP